MNTVHQQQSVAPRATAIEIRANVDAIFGDMDVHPDTEPSGEIGGGLECLVGASERRVQTDHASTTGPEEPITLGQSVACRHRGGRRWPRSVVGRTVVVPPIGDAVGGDDTDADRSARVRDDR